MAEVNRTQSDSAPSRRQFITQSSALVAGGALAANLNIARGAHPGSSDTIKVGLVGCGGRGTGACVNALSAEGGNVKIVALADTFGDQLDACLRKLKRRYPDRVDVPEERQFVGLDAYEHVISGDCDVVILATPPGFRPIHFEAAVKAGKHVFMEKPVAVDAPGIRRVLAAGKIATKKGLSVGVGLQRRHDPMYIEAVQRLQDGAIGDVMLSRVYWNSGGLWLRSRAEFYEKLGREPTEMEYQVRNWYYFTWICGDHIVEQHIHNLDVSNWVRQMVPAEANGMGGREVRTAPEYGQIFDHHFVEFTYPDGTKMMSQCRHIDGCWNKVSEYFHGTGGTAYLSQSDSGRINSGKHEWNYGGEKLDSYVQEHVDLLASIRAGTPYNETEYGATSTMTAILGRMATYSGKRITWDQAINSQVDLSPHAYAWDADPPVLPDAQGHYPVPVPGVTKVV